MDLFLEKMKDLLKTEYPKYLDVKDNEPYRAIRINTLKASKEKLLPLLDFVGEKTPFCDDGYYINSSEKSVGNNPLHLAGAYYVQEPSAMSAVEMLDVEKGDIVLDLCAAPGGKSTQIVQKLDGTGLLWTNEIVKNRANILLSNIERMGIKNAIISNNSPESLCNQLVKYFDKILVDAPCSGEGMFRKDKDARSFWSQEHVESCASRQLKILESAKDSLKDGGTLVYSTCTFSIEENEGVIENFLSNNKDFKLIDIKRVFPFDGGEGHFVAKLLKDGKVDKAEFSNDEIEEKEIKEFLDDIFISNKFKNIKVINDSIYSLPYSEKSLPSLNNLGVIRAGVKIGEIRKGRIEPHHNLFTASKKEDFSRVVDLKIDDEKLYKYLEGEEIDIDKDIKGYTAVLVEGLTLGFGKASGGKLKNKYPKGLRING